MFYSYNNLTYAKKSGIAWIKCGLSYRNYEQLYCPMKYMQTNPCCWDNDQRKVFCWRSCEVFRKKDILENKVLHYVISCWEGVFYGTYLNISGCYCLILLPLITWDSPYIHIHKCMWNCRLWGKRKKWFMLDWIVLS